MSDRIDYSNCIEHSRSDWFLILLLDKLSHYRSGYLCEESEDVFNLYGLRLENQKKCLNEIRDIIQKINDAGYFKQIDEVIRKYWNKWDKIDEGERE